MLIELKNSGGWVISFDIVIFTVSRQSARLIFISGLIKSVFFFWFILESELRMCFWTVSDSGAVTWNVCLSWLMYVVETWGFCLGGIGGVAHCLPIDTELFTVLGRSGDGGADLPPTFTKPRFVLSLSEPASLSRGITRLRLELELIPSSEISMFRFPLVSSLDFFESCLLQLNLLVEEESQPSEILIQEIILIL